MTFTDLGRLPTIPAPNADTTGAGAAQGECLRELCSAAHNANLWQNQHNPKMAYSLPRLTEE